MTNHQLDCDISCALRRTKQLNGRVIDRVAVIGAGLMGHGIALEFAAHGYSVTLHDADEGQLERSRGAISDGLPRLRETRTVTADMVDSAQERISLATDLHSAAATADLVVEAVTEDLQVKQDMFARLDAAAPRHAILASNTSSFMPSLLAAATTRPEQVLVAHYFNPPHLLPLVELVRSDSTSDETVETMRALYVGIGKQPVVVPRELPGFIGNRLQMALLREALALVESGVASPRDVDTVIKTSFGRRLAFAGVFEIFDAAGLDVTLAVADQLFPQIDRSQQPPSGFRERVAQGALGVKSGRGFYDWTPEEADELRRRIGQGVTAVARQSNT
jgi:3-hydroxybutyryl-CoA dehydrogenase